MNELAAERLARVHRQFLDAADRFSQLHHVAAGNRDAGGDWPEVQSEGGERSLGLPNAEWYPILRKPNGTFFAPLQTHWLRIDGALWEGAFFNDGPTWDDVRRQAKHFDEAMEALADGMKEYSNALRELSK